VHGSFNTILTTALDCVYIRIVNHWFYPWFSEHDYITLRCKIWCSSAYRLAKLGTDLQPVTVKIGTINDFNQSMSLATFNATEGEGFVSIHSWFTTVIYLLHFSSKLKFPDMHNYAHREIMQITWCRGDEWSLHKLMIWRRKVLIVKFHHYLIYYSLSQSCIN
jgi:hypothetical protein